ncbi:S1C family serine protease [Deinococcus maricopensis]|uniref:Peptidase S1 and S6 chymotrypsin/Hap n=1 Tax=Deinococcus maricopensis (strain DSM 21211 / LMG 22137 / NRRL B-23946 / LB-34) TaxID=709986 RepID=E8U7V1_DEIML|nr:trypsin-like peptidase domain-containing protein [Deinococcus maricopensis]ADV67140.1 peptidase S1 and S6 chymotrypsin/Hap [Deinococcus maricopensis DSM 21211]
MPRTYPWPLLAAPITAALLAVPFLPNPQPTPATASSPAVTAPPTTPGAPFTARTSPSTAPDASAPWPERTRTDDATASRLERAYTSGTAAAVRVNIGDSGLGSGFFISSDGYVMTAAHVALGGEHGDGADLSVITDDGTSHPARLVGYDEARDLAVLKVDGQGFAHLNFAARTPNVGDGVVAIGNSRGAFDGGRAGAVTALNASLDATFPTGLVASSMPLAPGDSGGPVLNAQGEVVGVSTAISLQGGNFSSYFVPLTGSSSIVRDLQAGTRRGVPVVGVSVAEPSALGLTGTGAVVTGLTSGLGGERAGLRAAQLREYRDANGDARQTATGGDIITAIDGRAIKAPDDLITYLRGKQPGDRVTLTVQRDGRSLQVNVTLSAKRTA